METIRNITQIIRGQDTSDGAGVKLKRILGSPELNLLDPFLLLDEFKNDQPEDYAAGFPDHPHRGFETLTYLLSGEFTHRDSKGHEGHLKSGAVQWMTAGRGLIHSEIPEQTDGLAWGYQLWLNLPAKHKMVEPKYQDIPSEKLPVVEKDGARVKVLAGEYGGAKSPGQSFIPFSYLDVELKPGAVFDFPAPPDQNSFLYVFKGKAKTGSAENPSYVKTGYLGVYGGGDRVRVEASEGEPARFLFASAQKIGEPVARGGPFVMNTIGEVKKAFLDYQSGNFA
ncbi:MAG TPA: pirin family protein [bacterium]|nr:pirin family protein [bacterium]